MSGVDAPSGRSPIAVPLERERERRLFLRVRRFGDEAARERLIESFMPLALHLARRYKRGDESIEDLVQVANVGLVKAVDRFEPARGTAFSTYAVPTILGELKRYFRDAGWPVHVPRGAQERALRVSAISTKLTHTLGRAPTAGELVDATGMRPEDVLEAIETATAARAESLDRVARADEEESREIMRPISCDELGYVLVEDRDAVERGLETLSERQRTIIRLRFEDELTQSQIADRVGISQMQVSRVIRRTLETLRLRVGAGSGAESAAV